jgi:hypothetical protein
MGISCAQLVTALQEGDSLFGASIATVMASLVLYSLAAWIFWLLACARFRKEFAGKKARPRSIACWLS